MPDQYGTYFWEAQALVSLEQYPTHSDQPLRPEQHLEMEDTARQRQPRGEHLPAPESPAHDHVYDGGFVAIGADAAPRDLCDHVARDRDTTYAFG